MRRILATTITRSLPINNLRFTEVKFLAWDFSVLELDLGLAPKGVILFSLQICVIGVLLHNVQMKTKEHVFIPFFIHQAFLLSSLSQADSVLGPVLRG